MGPKGVALYGSISLADLTDKEACTLRELPAGTVMLISESTVRAMKRIVEMEVNDCVIWDGATCWHTLSNTRLLVNVGMFVFKDPETGAWSL